MSKINDGGPAFATSVTETRVTKREEGDAVLTNYGSHPGMTLRDYFAAQALCGDMASQDEDFRFYVSDRENVIVERAVLCYRFADAMLKAKEAKP